MSLGLESLMRQAGCESGYMTPKYGPRFISSRTDLVVICDTYPPNEEWACRGTTIGSGTSSGPTEAVGCRYAAPDRAALAAARTSSRVRLCNGPCRGGPVSNGGMFNDHECPQVIYGLWPPPFLNNLCHYCTS